MRTLQRILRELVRRHGPEIAGEPLTEVIGGIGETQGMFVLRGLSTISGRAELGAVLEHPQAQWRFDKRLGPGERAALLDDLAKWSRTRAEAERARLVEERDRAAANAERELVERARELGVEPLLHDPVAVLAPFVDGGSWAADTLRYFGRGTVHDAALGRVSARSLSEAAIAEAARRYLEHSAETIATQARRETLWQRMPDQPALARLIAPLRVLESSLHARARGREAPLAEAGVVLDAAALALRVQSGSEVVLDLSAHELGVLVVGPDHAPPEIAVALVRIALDAVHDPAHRLRAPLAAALSQPSWMRFAANVESALASAPAPDEARRLMFRVSADSRGAPQLEAVVQRRGAAGRWTKGSRASFGDALYRFDHSPAVALALHRIGNGSVAGTPDALYALAEAPGLVIDERGETLEVRRVEAGFALAEQREGAAPSLSLGDVLVPFSQISPRLQSSGCVAHFVPERRLIVVAPIDSRLLAIVRAGARHSCVVAPADQPALLPLIEQLAARVPVQLTPALEADVRTLEPALLVRIEPDEQGAGVEIRTRLSRSISAVAGEGAALVSVIAEGSAVPALRRRQLAREREAALVLASELALPEGAVRARIDDEDTLVALLAALYARPELEVEWPERGQRSRYLGEIRRSGMRVSVRTAAQWFGVEGEVEIDGETISLAELLAQVRAGRRFVRLGAGRFAAIEAELRARLERAADVIFASGRAGLAVVPASGDALEALAEDGALRADAAWSRIRARLAAGALGEPRVPRKLRAKLRDYQREGFAWLARLASLEAGAVLADDMGLGKTVQALALLVHRAAEGPALVVAPTSLADNWAREAARFAPSLRVRLLRGPSRHAALASDPPRAGDLLLASYDVVALDVEALSKVELGTLVLDEAQAVKNPDAQRTKAVRELRARARVALTGTPLENRLSELWSLVSIVHPGLLGSWEHFRARFALPIERDGDAERLAALAAVVRPYLLRRTKEVVTPELPARIEMIREVELSSAERRLYEAERADAIAKLAEADDSERFQVLASITRLRQLACDASLVVPDAGLASSKLAALMELVEELEGAGRRVLVFSQFVRLLEHAAELLDARGTTHLMLDGSTPAAERGRLVERFQRGEASVFLLSLKAGGTGLNLTAADHVVHLDPWWNPAVEDQASDRAHRIGQDKPVTIVRLVAQDTIEQSVLALHEQKRALSRGVLEGADVAGALSASELVALIRGGEAETTVALRRRRRA